MNKHITIFNDIPLPEKDPEFWNQVKSPGVSKLINVMILNEIRSIQFERLTFELAVAKLAKLQSYQELMDNSITISPLTAYDQDTQSELDKL